MPDATVAGYVLAGGRSSRMGEDKAGLPWRGKTLLSYIAGEVRAAAGSVAVVGGAERSELRVIPDDLPGFGPLAGIAKALADSGAEWTLIVACDMPYLTRAWLCELIAGAAGQVTVPRTSDGRIHPLAAVWHRSAREPVREAVASGIHTVREVVQALDCRWFGLGDARHVANVNTPRDWSGLRE